MKKKKLLILNGSHSEIPLIDAGKELGFHVITTGNIPTLIGHKHADEYFPADFSDKEEILKLANRLEIDAICSCANDFGALTSAYVAEKMGLPGHDSYKTALTLHHKDIFKEFSKENNIKTPYAESFDNKHSALSSTKNTQLPLIIKPVDLTGGKGVSTVLSINELQNSIEKAFHLSRAKRIVIEEFFEGTQHSFSTFISNKKVVSYFSDNEFSFVNPYLVSTSAAPATNIDKFIHGLIATAEKTANILQLVDGILHFQYLANSESFTIIEMTRRCSGDLYPYPVEHSSNINWSELIVRAETGIKYTIPKSAKQTGYCGRHCIMSDKNGIIEDIIISEHIKNNIYNELMWWKKGDTINDYMTQKLGILLLDFSSKEEMHEKIGSINQLIEVSIK